MQHKYLVIVLLFFNGRYVGRFEVNGYLPHHFDITNFIESGKENTIAVLADNRFNPTFSPDPYQTGYLKYQLALRYKHMGINLYPYNMKVVLNDAKGLFEYVSDDAAVGIQDVSDIGEREPMSVTNYFESHGVSPVVINVATNKEGAQTWFNGLSFKRIK